MPVSDSISTLGVTKVMLAVLPVESVALRVCVPLKIEEERLTGRLKLPSVPVVGLPTRFPSRLTETLEEAVNTAPVKFTVSLGLYTLVSVIRYGTLLSTVSDPISVVFMPSEAEIIMVCRHDVGSLHWALLKSTVAVEL